MIPIEKLYPRVAIIADQMLSFGGADRELYSMLKLFPSADIFTIIFDKTKYPELKNKVYTSKLQTLFKFLPFSLGRHSKVFTPWAYENFDVDNYDLVISISAGPAKGIITGITQPHIAMTMTPPRALWDKEHNFRGLKLRHLYLQISNWIDVFMRLWDMSIAKRVNYWTANSKYIQKKIKKIYGVESTLIYPGVEEKYFNTINKKDLQKVISKYSLPQDFVLVVSRLYDYKRVDWAIETCIETGKNLVIIGEGPDLEYLKKVADDNPNIKFIGHVSDEEVISFYNLAQVLLFCGIEDFGLVPVEAMAAGTPVIALREGGTTETIKEHVSGEFFNTKEELCILLNQFDKRRYNRKTVIEQAKQFSEEKFLNNLEIFIRKVYEKETQK